MRSPRGRGRFLSHPGEHSTAPSLGVVLSECFRTHQNQNDQRNRQMKGGRKREVNASKSKGKRRSQQGDERQEPRRTGRARRRGGGRVGRFATALAGQVSFIKASDQSCPWGRHPGRRRLGTSRIAGFQGPRQVQPSHTARVLFLCLWPARCLEEGSHWTCRCGTAPRASPGGRATGQYPWGMPQFSHPLFPSLFGPWLPPPGLILPWVFCRLQLGSIPLLPPAPGSSGARRNRLANG